MNIKLFSCKQLKNITNKVAHHLTDVERFSVGVLKIIKTEISVDLNRLKNRNSAQTTVPIINNNVLSINKQEVSKAKQNFL